MKNITRAAAVMAAAILVTVPAHAQQSTARAHGGEPSAATTAQKSTISVERISAAIRTVKFANRPFNLIIPETLSALNEAVKALGKDDDVKVVVFTSEVPGFFFNHFDMNEFPNFLSQVGADSKPLWVELISNLSKAPFISIASIHGRSQGGGDELALAFDLRYASKEQAVFGQPEVGLGLFPGGGATGHLARLIGRDRALEVLLGSDDYNAESAEKFGWITRAIPDAELDGFVARIAARLASFDKTALATTKRQINAVAYPSEAERLGTYIEFTKSLSGPGLQQRLPVFGKLIQEVGPLKVENDLGYYIGLGNQRLQDATQK
ncbi:MAG TPA: enoyl-CoA hydratase/isomerase family protein [Duganella sp.]|jgi:enoyl-CoA hydratase/carnithine racemase